MDPVTDSDEDYSSDGSDDDNNEDEIEDENEDDEYVKVDDNDEKSAESDTENDEKVLISENAIPNLLNNIFNPIFQLPPLPSFNSGAKPMNRPVVQTVQTPTFSNVISQPMTQAPTFSNVISQPTAPIPTFSTPISQPTASIPSITTNQQPGGAALIYGLYNPNLSTASGNVVQPDITYKIPSPKKSTKTIYYTKQDLETLRGEDLKEICRIRSMKGFSNKKKDDLVSFLLTNPLSSDLDLKITKSSVEEIITIKPAVQNAQTTPNTSSYVRQVGSSTPPIASVQQTPSFFNQFGSSTPPIASVQQTPSFFNQFGSSTPPIASVQQTPSFFNQPSLSTPPIASVQQTPPIASVQQTPPIASVQQTPPIASVQQTPSFFNQPIPPIPPIASVQQPPVTVNHTGYENPMEIVPNSNKIDNQIITIINAPRPNVDNLLNKYANEKRDHFTIRKVITTDAINNDEPVQIASNIGNIVANQSTLGVSYDTAKM